MLKFFNNFKLIKIYNKIKIVKKIMIKIFFNTKLKLYISSYIHINIMHF